MNLTERINREPERRQSDVQPVVERRKVPRWMEWTRDNQRSGKDLTGTVAA